MLLVGQGMGIRPIKTSASKPPVILPCWLMGGVYIAWSTLWVQITENWESRRQPVNPSLPEKWPLKWCVHACVFSNWRHGPLRVNKLSWASMSKLLLIITNWQYTVTIIQCLHLVPDMKWRSLTLTVSVSFFFLWICEIMTELENVCRVHKIKSNKCWACQRLLKILQYNTIQRIHSLTAK